MRSPDFIRERAKSMRRAMTAPEKTLWFLLRRNSLGCHFRRQHPIGPFILDFYCAALRLCVAVDGPVHSGQAERDERRTNWLKKEGIMVIRFSAEEVETRSAGVVAAIARAAAPSTA
ncbi:endonuclease domain-containing protein [Devosia sp.]|uniref:endonuclease domain-containing protein n=1 Tax=Devosia sp. TaxID=1871048 RepID=UPI00262BBD2E|nr:endonuclease domain-containing protein [Devosia sp.]